MKISVKWSKWFTSTGSKVRFCMLVRKCLMNMCRYLIIKNRNRINNKLKSLDLTYKDLLQNLNQFIVVTPFPGGFIVGYSHITRIGKYPMPAVAKSLDFGSSLTGKPIPIFVRSLNALIENMDNIYRQFIGLAWKED